MEYNYLKNILGQILDSYNKLRDINDKAGDLDTIQQELVKMEGMVKVLVNKIHKSGNYSNSYSELLKAAKIYFRDHNFYNEIERINMLYSQDAFRIRNIRLSIIAALEESKLISKSKELFKIL